MKSILIVAISFVIFSVVTAEEKKNQTVTWCYECTSVWHPGCADSYEGSDKFPHESKLKLNYSKKCDQADLLPHTEPGQPKPVAVGCRKILQEVDGQTRVVRECAYNKPDGSDEVSGLKRTGNQGVRLFYYQCPRDYCNGAHRQISPFLIFSFSVPFLFVLLARW